MQQNLVPTYDFAAEEISFLKVAFVCFFLQIIRKTQIQITGHNLYLTEDHKGSGKNISA